MTADDQPLLQALAAAIAADRSETLADLPLADLSEQLADRLMAIGACGAAARWRGWSLLPADRPTLLTALGEATFLLSQDPSLAAVATPRLAPGWQALLEALDQGAAPARLEALVRQLLPVELPPRDLLDDLVGRLEQVGAAMAALLLLLELWKRQPAGAPPEPQLCNRLARLQRQSGDVRQAELWYRRSLGTLPQQPLVWFQLARCFLDQGAEAEALECSEAGLGQWPGHGWGRKLRVRALVASGAWHTLMALERLGGLPEEPEVSEAALAPARRRLARAAALPSRPEPSLPLDQRLRLRQELAGLQGPVLLVQARRAEALTWLVEQQLVPRALTVHPLASADPLLLRDQLDQSGLQPLPERSLLALPELERPPGLLVLERGSQRRLPRALAPLVTAPGGPLILARRGLLRLPPARLLGRLAGWELFGPARLEASGAPPDSAGDAPEQA